MHCRVATSKLVYKLAVMQESSVLLSRVCAKHTCKRVDVTNVQADSTQLLWQQSM